MVFYETKAKFSLDPIVGLVQTAAEDNSVDKLLAIVGSAMDDSGKLIVPDTVNQVASELCAKSLNMAYSPSSGLKDLAPLISQEFIGKETLDSIALGINRTNLYNFELLNEDDSFNIKSYEKITDRAVKSRPSESNSKITLILNSPFDNPLGKDFGDDVWKQIASILAKYPEQEFLVILDIAYIDFGPEAKNYNKLSFLKDFFATVNSEKLSVVVAATLSKSFAMYRTSQEIAFEVLNDETKLAQIHQFQKDTVAMIERRKNHFIDSISPKLPEELALIKPDGGFFVSLKIKNEILNRFPEAGKELSERFIQTSTYIPVLLDQYLRIPVCGLREELLDQVTERILKYTVEVLVPA